MTVLLPARHAAAELGDVTSGVPLELRKGDVVAFVGGESAVLEGERGHLESLIVVARPELGLRFRNLGWEGDTVFEQPRDVNFPDVPELLKRNGATVVVCRFGQYESLAGPEGLDRFIAAYGAFCDRITAGTRRRVVLITPNFFGKPRDPLLPDLSKHNADVRRYANAILALAQRRGHACANLSSARVDGEPATENGVRPTPRESGHDALLIAKHLGLADGPPDRFPDEAGRWPVPEMEALREAVVAKNKIWFDYWRPMNWAFLGGDRVQVPSSHDHRDPSIRWFPGEIEKFLPLLTDAEKRVDEAARKAAASRQ